jgi:hypothetical protein
MLPCCERTPSRSARAHRGGRYGIQQPLELREYFIQDAVQTSS